MKSERHLAAFTIGQDILLDLLRHFDGHWIKLEFPALPEDAKLLSVHYDWERRSFICHFEHPSFAPVAAGEVVQVVGHLTMGVRREEEALGRAVDGRMYWMPQEEG